MTHNFIPIFDNQIHRKILIWWKRRSIAKYDLPSTNSALVLFLGKTKLLSCHELDNAYLSLV